MGFQVCECIVGARWKFGGEGDCGREVVTLGVCDFLLLVGNILVGVGDVCWSGGEVLSGVVGRGSGGSVDGSSGIVVANKEPLVGGGVIDDDVVVSGGGGGVGSGGSGGRSSGQGFVKSQS